MTTNKEDNSILKWTNGTLMEKSEREKKILDTTYILKSTNERDLHNQKLISRYMVTQTNINPFMANNDYIKDLATQDEFLIPQNSSIISHESK
jgi:hypothetical protein|tara:strand:+ start:2543 stop:2821 length:279 start_codon:yes stop_codon:yes gene_type:complete